MYLSTDNDTFFPTDRICYLSTDMIKSFVSTDSTRHILSVEGYPLVNNSLSTDFYLSTDKEYIC